MSGGERSGTQTKVALVTGATRGIGRAVALRLAQDGFHLGLAARTRDDLHEVVRRADPEGSGAVAPFPMDVTDPQGVEKGVAALLEWAGAPVDVVVHAAGVFSLAPAVEESVRTFDLHLDVNLRGAFIVSRAVLPRMLARGRGTLVNVGSVAGRKALPGNAAYSASKFGLRGFHEVLLEELRGTGVRATLLEPAATDTSIWDPLDPDESSELPSRADMLRPEEVAEAVAFVAGRPDSVQIPYLPVERS